MTNNEPFRHSDCLKESCRVSEAGLGSELSSIRLSDTFIYLIIDSILCCVDAAFPSAVHFSRDRYFLYRESVEDTSSWQKLLQSSTLQTTAAAAMS